MYKSPKLNLATQGRSAKDPSLTRKRDCSFKERQSRIGECNQSAAVRKGKGTGYAQKLIRQRSQSHEGARRDC